MPPITVGGAAHLVDDHARLGRQLVHVRVFQQPHAGGEHDRLEPLRPALRRGDTGGVWGIWGAVCGCGRVGVVQCDEAKK